MMAHQTKVAAVHVYPNLTRFERKLLMPVIEEKLWEKAQANNTDPYGNACIMVARRAMEILDEEPGEIDPHALITRADKESGAGGITGFMAGAAANIISGVHSRGEEFRKAWNKDFGVEEGDGVVNPAILNIEV